MNSNKTIKVAETSIIDDIYNAGFSLEPSDPNYSKDIDDIFDFYERKNRSDLYNFRYNFKSILFEKIKEKISKNEDRMAKNFDIEIAKTCNFLKTQIVAGEYIVDEKAIDDVMQKLNNLLIAPKIEAAFSGDRSRIMAKLKEIFEREFFPFYSSREEIEQKNETERDNKIREFLISKRVSNNMNKSIKIANLINAHISGKQNRVAKRILGEIEKKALAMGLVGPFKIIRVAIGGPKFQFKSNGPGKYIGYYPEGSNVLSRQYGAEVNSTEQGAAIWRVFDKYGNIIVENSFPYEKKLQISFYPNNVMKAFDAANTVLRQRLEADKQKAVQPMQYSQPTQTEQPIEQSSEQLTQPSI